MEHRATLLPYNGFFQGGKSLKFHKSSANCENFTLEVFTTTIYQFFSALDNSLTFQLEKLE